MSLVPRWRYPYTIVKGVDNALTLDVYTRAGVQQTASVATVSVYQGATALVSGASATSLGPPASYTLTAATTTALSLDDATKWKVEWSMTIGGTDYVFRRPAYFSQYDVFLQVVPQDVYDVEDAVQGLLGTTFTSIEPQIEDAWLRVLRHLVQSDVRPHLVTDSGALVGPTIACALETIFGTADGAHGQDGPGLYGRKHTEWAQKAADGLDRLVLAYDSNEDGVEDAHRESLPESMPRERSRDW